MTTNSFSQGSNSYNDKDSLLSLKPPDLALLYNQFNNTSPKKNSDPENVVNSTFYDIDQIQTLKYLDKHKSLALFHINARSLNKSFNDLFHVLKCTNKVFDIIAVSENRITKQTSLTTNINLKNYAIEFTSTESSAEGTLLCIASHLSYIPCTDLNIYKANQLESTLFEIINPGKNPNMDVFNFKNNDLNHILEILSKEQKKVFLLGDFNINFLNCNDHQPINDFLDSLASNSFFPYILNPTRITGHSKTLIDNIFSNDISHEITSGNINATISDHLPQFSFVSNILSNSSSQKSKFHERDWSKFKQENFILDYFDKDWADLLQIDQQNVNFSMDIFLNKMDSILNTHAPLKKVNKYKLKFKIKPWITPALQKSISIKSNLLKKFITVKDPQIKERYHKENKDYRNLLSTILKQSKTNYFNHYFESTGTALKIHGKA